MTPHNSFILINVIKNEEHIGELAAHSVSFPDGSEGKESTCNAGDKGDSSSIPGSGRSLRGENGLGNPTDRGAWRVTVQKVTKN